MTKCYYGIHVKTGMEVSIANKLNTLNEKLNGSLFNSLYIPFESTSVINLEKKTLKQHDKLLFNSYLFVETSEALTSEQYNIIKQSSCFIYKILVDEITEDDFNRIFGNDVLQKAEIVLHQDVVKVNQLMPKLKELIEKLKNCKSTYKNYIQLLHVNNRVRFKLNRQIFIDIARQVKLTVRELLLYPAMFIKGVLAYYESRTIDQTISFKV